MTLTRVTVNLSPKATEALRSASNITGLSKTDAVNRALQLYQLWLEQEASGGEWHIKKDGKFAQVFLV